MAVTTQTGQPSAPKPSGPAHLLRLIELGKPLGRGAMGTVYAARVRQAADAPPGGPTEVAVRVLSSRFYADAAFMSRFYADAVAARRLQHPAIVPVLDVAEISGRHCMATELVHGLSLDRWVEKHGKIPEPKLLLIALAVAEAMKTALDQERLLHRSLRPHNIFVDHNGGHTRVADIGLARAAADDHGKPLPDQPVGDPHYTAPELTKGERQGDCRGDIYALGATLYHLATGVKPFGELQGPAALAGQRQGHLEDPRESTTALSEGFCQMLARMLARRPTDRYVGYEQLIADLQALSKGGRPRTAAIEHGKTVVRPRGSKGAAKAPAHSGKVSISTQKRPSAESAVAPPAEAPAAPAVQPERRVHHHPSWMTTRMVITAWVLVPVLIVACILAWLYRDSQHVERQYQQMLAEVGDNWSNSPNPSTEEFASRLLARASAYVRANPSHTKGIAARYEAVARRFPLTHAGRSAAKEAERWRERQ